MKVTGATLGIVVCLLLLPVLSFAHDECGYEQQQHDSAVSAKNAAADNFFFKATASSGLIAAIAAENQRAGRKKPTPTQAAALAIAAAESLRAYNKLQDAKKKVTSTKASLDNCRARADRKCGCSIAHTQNPTDCGCSYKRWNGWCHCPTVSPSQQQGGG